MTRAIAGMALLLSATLLAQPKVDVAAALKTVTPDLNQRLARFKPVKMPYNAAGLSAREREMVEHLVVACRELESMYWRQSDPEALALYNALEPDKSPLAQNLRHYLFINGSRFDLVDSNKPFVGTTSMPPGHALYPAGLTRADIEAYVARNPSRKQALYNPYTFVVRTGPGNSDLSGEWYHSRFAEFTRPAAAALRKAADLSDDPAFARFLRLRATAILSDDYYASDIAWLDLKDPKFDIIYAPYDVFTPSRSSRYVSYGA